MKPTEFDRFIRETRKELQQASDCYAARNDLCLQHLTDAHDLIISLMKEVSERVTEGGREMSDA